MNEDLGEEQFEEFMENIDEVDSDDEIQVDLHERIKDINLNNPDEVWDALTEDERNDFEALLSKGISLSVICCLLQYLIIYSYMDNYSL